MLSCRHMETQGHIEEAETVEGGRFRSEESKAVVVDCHAPVDIGQ